MSDVFVSYKAEDRPRVRPLVEALQAEGLSVWWDERVGGGETWREAIEQELDCAGCVIVMWSKRSVGPEGRFVRDEAARAQRHGTYVPVRIDRVDPPLGFGETQALPLNGWKGDRSDPRYHAVSGCVHSLLGRKAPPALASRRATRISRRTAIAGGGAAVAAAAAGGWLLLRPSGARDNTIAVLPFANLSGDPSQSYFSDGLAEELRSALAALGLQVVARTSSEMLRNADARTAAERLSVANVITGSVRRSPSTVRVSAQLVDGNSGLERWSQTFDRPLGDVLHIQSDIAQNVAGALSVELGGGASKKVILGGTTNVAAHDLVLQATATQGDDSSEGLLRRIALFRRATELDPNYAEAHARKGFAQAVWSGTWSSSTAEKDRVAADAEQSIRRAIAIAPSMPLGHSALGVLLRNQIAVGEAVEPLRRAVELPGADSAAFSNYAISLCSLRRQAEAEAAIGRAISLDPLNPVARTMKALILFYGRRFPESLETARSVRAMAPQNRRATALIGWNLLMLGRFEDARRALRVLPADDYRRLVGEATIAARSGRKDSALQAIHTLQLRHKDTANYQLAEIYAQLGMRKQAIAALEAAWSARDSGLAVVSVDPFVDPIRDDPAFVTIQRRVFG